VETYFEEEGYQFRSNSTVAASGLMGLGAALMRCKEYMDAFSVYKKAVKILRHRHGENNLIVAHALDKVGLAASLCPKVGLSDNLEWALMALNEAFHIRHSILGPWHCDVVDTLNNIAGVYMRQRELIKAIDSYVEVITVRSAIFGEMHPSVAVTSQTLGTLHLWMSNFHEALQYFNYTLRIYKSDSMKLKDRHPLVQKAHDSIKNTERLLVSGGNG